MAVVRVTNTYDGRAAIRYALEEASHKEGMDRALAVRGVNTLEVDAHKQMRDVWKRFGKADGDYVQMYRIIQSFDDQELNPQNEEDVNKCNEIGAALAKELYPRHQALVITQADGDGGKLHNHILVNSVSFIDGRSMQGVETRWQHIAAASDEILQENGLSVLPSLKARRKESMAQRKLSEKGEYVWKNDLMTRIDTAMQDDDFRNHDDFAREMAVQGVDVRFRARNKSGKVTGVSYKFTDDEGKARTARGSTLGEDFKVDQIDEIAAKNQARADRIAADQASKKPEPMPEETGSDDTNFSFDIRGELARVRSNKPKKRPKRAESPQEPRRASESSEVTKTPETQSKTPDEPTETPDAFRERIERARKEVEEKERIEREKQLAEEKAKREVEKAEQERERLKAIEEQKAAEEQAERERIAAERQERERQRLDRIRRVVHKIDPNADPSDDLLYKFADVVHTYKDKTTLAGKSHTPGQLYLIANRKLREEQLGIRKPNAQIIENHVTDQEEEDDLEY